MTWYPAKMGNDHQALVIESGSGRNVAVSYDKRDAPLIAAAPEMLALIKSMVQWDRDHGEGGDVQPDQFVRTGEELISRIG